MIRVKLLDKFNNLSVNDFNSNEEIEKYLNDLDSKNLLKKERWVQAKELMKNGDSNEPERWMWHSEYYEDSDVLQTEERISDNTGESTSWVLLKAEYTIEIIDLDQDYDWLLSECHRKRKKEYPPLSELGDSLYWKENGDPSKYEKYIKKCDEVKKKYPLPLRQEI